MIPPFIQPEIDALLGRALWVIPDNTLIKMLRYAISCNVHMVLWDHESSGQDAPINEQSINRIDLLLLTNVRSRLTENRNKEDCLIDRRTPQEILLAVPEVRSAVDKLLSYKWKIEYQRAKWRAAVSVMTWLQVNFIDTGRLKKEELRIIPLFVFRDFDVRLYQAIMNCDRYK